MNPMQFPIRFLSSLDTYGGNTASGDIGGMSRTADSIAPLVGDVGSF